MTNRMVLSPMRRLLIPALPLLVASALMMGCDQQKVAKMESGVATETEMMKEFGAPVEIYREADGSRVFEYTRQPEGSTNYFITVSPEGRVTALQQVLTPKYFEQVKPGMTVAQVRRLLGQPAVKQAYELKKEEVWDWRWLDDQTRKVFRVTYDYSGKVLTSAVVNDPRDFETGGR